MYKVQKHQYKLRYNDHSNMDERILVPLETFTIEYKDLPGLAHKLSVSVDRLQATLESRSPEIKTGDGYIYRGYPWTYREPREVEPLESPTFVKQIEARNVRIKRNGKTASTLEGWQGRTTW